MLEKKATALNLKKIEILIYIIIWSIVFLMPVIFTLNNAFFNWDRIYREWIRTSTYLVIFCIHNFILFPVFFERKKILYLLITVLMIVGIGLLGDWAGRMIQQAPNPVRRPMVRPPFEMQRPLEIRPWIVVIFNVIIVSFLVVGFNAAIKLAVRSQEKEQKSKELEKQKLQSELAFLRNQVSPHFFMNTLNNIHALIDINSEGAKNSIIKLSKLMRYMLYDTEHGKTTLKKEVDFIRSFVDLMKLRLTDDIKVTIDFPEKIPSVSIPPMIFTSLVENAFKHGISYQSESFVEIILKIERGWLLFRTVNSNHNLKSKIGGIGLKNLKKRLELLYKDEFSFEVISDKINYETLVKIPLNED
ncbi:MAG: histidine kinase [Prolixibacteraceae bacterium]|nr:histidine kinase [Prolixibacteraceae bacterium]